MTYISCTFCGGKVGGCAYCQQHPFVAMGPSIPQTGWICPNCGIGCAPTTPFCCRVEIKTTNNTKSQDLHGEIDSEYESAPINIVDKKTRVVRQRKPEELDCMIDFETLKVGDEVWSSEMGNVTIFDLSEYDEAFPIKVRSDNMYTYTLCGKCCVGDKYPTLFKRKPTKEEFEIIYGD